MSWKTYAVLTVFFGVIGALTVTLTVVEFIAGHLDPLTVLLGCFGLLPVAWAVECYGNMRYERMLKRDARRVVRR